MYVLNIILPACLYCLSACLHSFKNHFLRLSSWNDYFDFYKHKKENKQDK